MYRHIFLKQISVLGIFALLCTSFVYADSASDLQQKIDDRNNQIKQLEDEIKMYNDQVNVVSGQATSLQNTLKTLDLTQKKINADISLTNQKINKANLTIEQINSNILDSNDKVDTNKKALVEALRNTQMQDEANVVQLILSSSNIADMWNDLNSSQHVQESIKGKSDVLRTLTKTLQTKQAALAVQKADLVALTQDLKGKQQAVNATKQQQATLLTQTKNKEQTYKQMIATREAQKAQFEKEVYDFESQLKLTIDQGSYPSPQHGILSWPLDDVFLTQKFGKTVGAEKLYVSGSHNGVDFRASIGTRVKNVLAGTVVGTGNTDIYPGCYSFGKWVMVKHDNGLSTIYGHLSVISVTQGQQLGIGDLIGYSGNTGYSTGPHLHISVYATEGVRIEQYVNSRGCKQAIIPLADIKAYLDPLAYFPNY